MTILELPEPKLKEPEEQNEGKDRKVVPFHVATGGGDSGGPWLGDLEVGTCFLARHGLNPILQEFWVVALARRAVKLLAVRDEKETYLWVDPVEFSREFKCYEVIDP